MNIFTKAELTRILSIKIKEGEIKNFSLTDSYLHIQKSKRTSFTFKLNNISDKTLLKIVRKKTPNPSLKNIKDFYISQFENIN
jgi:hypothetical protein